jgi:hypothetical protein
MKLKTSAAAETRLNFAPVVAPSRQIETTAGNALDQDDPSGGLALRHLLRMMAYDPTAARAPRQTFARLRPFVDGARRKLRRRHESGGTIDEYVGGLAQLRDGAVAGLCHVARFCADGTAHSIVPPFAAVAVGGLKHQEPSGTSLIDLLFLLPENPAVQERSGRMMDFVLTGLSDLGFGIKHASCTLPEAALLTETLPSFSASLRNARFVWGRDSLYAGLVNLRPKPATESRERWS